MPFRLIHAFARTSLFRFLIIGLCNTVLTYVVFLVCILWLGPRLSYLLSWALGLFFVSVLYPRFAFNVRRGARKASSLAAIAIYGSTLLLGFVVLELFMGLGLPPYISIVFVYPVVSLSNYGLMRSTFSFLSKPGRG